MTPARDATVAARVPHDLRNDLQAIADRDNVELSIIIRRILRDGADRELAGDTIRLGLFGDTAAGTARRRPTATELEAKLKAAPRIGTARFRALAEFDLAAARGLTADEVIVKLAPAPMNGTARRVTDLLQGRLVAPVRAPGGTITRRTYADERVMDDGHVARLTRAGAWANVYVITVAGHRALEDARGRERAKATTAPNQNEASHG